MGKHGKEDFDLLMADSDETGESATWFDVVEDEYTHDFRFGEDGDTFDPNDNAHREYNKMYNRDRARFDAADIDKDEKLTEGEFVLFKNPLKDENVKQVVIDEALKAVDTNGDGKIDLQEYLNDWRVPVSIMKRIKQKRTNILRFEFNNKMFLYFISKFKLS